MLSPFHGTLYLGQVTSAALPSSSSSSRPSPFPALGTRACTAATLPCVSLARTRSTGEALLLTKREFHGTRYGSTRRGWKPGYHTVQAEGSGLSRVNISPAKRNDPSGMKVHNKKPANVRMLLAHLRGHLCSLRNQALTLGGE